MEMRAGRERAVQGHEVASIMDLFVPTELRQDPPCKPQVENCSNATQRNLETLSKIKWDFVSLELLQRSVIRARLQLPAQDRVKRPFPMKVCL